jgi:hypothetical protein
MAAITDWAAYQALYRNPIFPIPLTKGPVTTIAGRPYDLFTAAAVAGTAPTTAAVPTNATTGALPIQNGDTGQLWVPGARLSSNVSGTFILCDRLSHSGGLSGTGTGVAQTTNLPTAALTRYTSGVGVMAMITVYTQIGTTAQTVTASYTDQDGNTGQTTAAVAIGATGFREANRAIFLPLAAGDSGVRAVASITITGATGTGTAGNLGVTLFKPLLGFVIERPGGQYTYSLVDNGMAGGMPEIVDNSCLFWIAIPGTTSTSFHGAVSFAES